MHGEPRCLGEISRIATVTGTSGGGTPWTAGVRCSSYIAGSASSSDLRRVWTRQQAEAGLAILPGRYNEEILRTETTDPTWRRSRDEAEDHPAARRHGHFPAPPAVIESAVGAYDRHGAGAPDRVRCRGAARNNLKKLLASTEYVMLHNVT